MHFVCEPTSLLLEAIITEARTRKLEKLELNVVTTQDAAQRLYKKFGFREIGIAQKALKIGASYYDEILMELFL